MLRAVISDGQKETAGPLLRFAPVGMTNLLKLGDFARKSIKSQTLVMTKFRVALPAGLGQWE